MKNNVIEDYLFKKVRCKNIRLDIEDCYFIQLTDDEISNRVNELEELYDNYQMFINAYDKAFNSLYKEEKYYVINKYYKDKLLIDMKPFYDENVCPFNKEDFNKYIWYLKRIILNKLNKKINEIIGGWLYAYKKSNYHIS